jgi:hypothetical protein
MHNGITCKYVYDGFQYADESIALMLQVSNGDNQIQGNWFSQYRVSFLLSTMLSP